MIAVFITFRYGEDFSEELVRKLAEGSRATFERMPGLRQKAFTVQPAKREAINVYLWNSDEAARALFTDDFLEHVTELYGVRPTVEFAQIAELVENEGEPILRNEHVGFCVGRI